MDPISHLADYHIHTARCGHATGAMEEYVRQARASGLMEMGFSDHIYMYWLPPEQRDPSLAMSEEEFPAYVEDVYRLQREFPDMSIRLAVEADYIPGWERQLTKALAPYPWDYVLGSVHFIGDWGFDDERHIARFQEWDVGELYERYFDLVCRGAESGLFDVMAHPDLVKKFGHRPSGDLRPLYAQVARRLKAADVCVEVNTAGLRKPVAEIYPAYELLREFRRAGLSATIGSDAHAPGQVAADYQRAVALLKEAGYTEVTVFKERRRQKRPLP